MRCALVLAGVLVFADVSPAAETGADRIEAGHPRFPRFETEALDRSRVTLPDSAAGHVTLLGFAFNRNLQDDLSSWLLPYLEEFADDRRFLAYEVPMMGTSTVVRLMRGTIDRGMRRSIPGHRHRFVLPFYQDYGDLSAELDMHKHSVIYVFLLDREGRIRWRREAPARGEDLAALFQLARRLAVEP